MLFVPLAGIALPVYSSLVFNVNASRMNTGNMIVSKSSLAYVLSEITQYMFPSL